MLLLNCLCWRFFAGLDLGKAPFLCNASGSCKRPKMSKAVFSFLRSLLPARRKHPRKDCALVSVSVAQSCYSFVCESIVNE
jgi:hypothetical protein